MFTAKFRRWLNTSILGLAVISLGLIFFTTPLEQSSCRTLRIGSLHVFYENQTGGLILEGENLASNCIMVVYRVSEINQPVPERYPQARYQALVSVIGGRYQTYIQAGDEALVRYQLFADCDQAVTVAREFIGKMRESGFYTSPLESFTPQLLCPQALG